MSHIELQQKPAKVLLPGPVKKPTKTKIRPSSASANLQTHPSFNPTTLLHENSRPLSAATNNSIEKDIVKRPVTHAGLRLQNNEKTPNLVYKKEIRHRRPTIDRTSNIENLPGINEELHVKSEKLFNQKKIEDKIGLEVLNELMKAFKKVQDHSNGREDGITPSKFETIIVTKLKLSKDRVGQVRTLFEKIDWSNSSSITWDQFCTYMQLDYEEKQNTYSKAREVTFMLPARVRNTPHRENVTRIRSSLDGNFIAGSTDGILSFWNPQLILKKKKNVIITSADQQLRQKSKWITDFLIMNEFNKLIVGTGDREIEFFELSSFEPYCRINCLETVPLCLDYACKKENPDETLLFWGDRNGCINILSFKATGECLRTWKKNPRRDGIAYVGMDSVLLNPLINFVCWKVHNDWVLSLKYYDTIRQVISCSNDHQSALVIGSTSGSTQLDIQNKEVGSSNAVGGGLRPSGAAVSAASATVGQTMQKVIPQCRLSADETRFEVYKGVRSFDFSKSKNLLVTGGMDRIVRIWNPYVNTKPTGLLRGHTAPIFYLMIANEENRLFSISIDKCVKVWDIHDHNCLLTIRPKGHKIRGELQACHYSPVSRSLLVATDQMSMLNIKMNEYAQQIQLEEKYKEMTLYAGHYFGTYTQLPADSMGTTDEVPVLHAEIVLSHKEGVTCVKYNEHFKQIITCSENSVVKVWDMETGTFMSEFSDAHGDAAINCLTFDLTGRRLITGGRDGVLKIWNYNNGHCLRELRKNENSYDEDSNNEVTSVQYFELSRNKFIVAAGWDRRINLFVDNYGESVHFVQYAQPAWPDDLRNGHREDILCLATCQPNLLATADYSGCIIVWNMISGHVFCRLIPPEPDNYVDESLDGDMSINKVVFLPSRQALKQAAALIASGPRGFIHFWSVRQGGKLLSHFQANPGRGHMVSAMTVNSTDSLLVTGDRFGLLCVWNISTYCLKGAETACPELLHRWQAHTEMVTCLDWLTKLDHIVSSSVDCTVRFWSNSGEFIGTLGQPEPWSVYEPDTWQHPMVPYDVLVDTANLPKHSYISDHDEVIEKKNTTTVNFESGSKDSNIIPEISHYQRQQFIVDDETIAEQIKTQSYKDGTGKRLRHERQKPIRIDRGGPSEYQMLHWYNLEEVPAVDESKTSKIKNNDESMMFDIGNDL